MKFTENYYQYVFNINYILLILILFLQLRGGHFATMETVTGALRFFKHIIIGNI